MTTKYTVEELLEIFQVSPAPPDFTPDNPMFVVDCIPPLELHGSLPEYSMPILGKYTKNQNSEKGKNNTSTVEGASNSDNPTKLSKKKSSTDEIDTNNDENIENKNSKNERKAVVKEFSPTPISLFDSPPGFDDIYEQDDGAEVTLPPVEFFVPANNNEELPKPEYVNDSENAPKFSPLVMPPKPLNGPVGVGIPFRKVDPNDKPRSPSPITIIPNSNDISTVIPASVPLKSPPLTPPRVYRKSSDQMSPVFQPSAVPTKDASSENKFTKPQFRPQKTSNKMEPPSVSDLEKAQPIEDDPAHNSFTYQTNNNGYVHSAPLSSKNWSNYTPYETKRDRNQFVYIPGQDDEKPKPKEPEFSPQIVESVYKAPSIKEQIKPFKPEQNAKQNGWGQIQINILPPAQKKPVQSKPAEIIRHEEEEDEKKNKPVFKPSFSPKEEAQIYEPPSIYDEREQEPEQEPLKKEQDIKQRVEKKEITLLPPAQKKNEKKKKYVPLDQIMAEEQKNSNQTTVNEEPEEEEEPKSKVFRPSFKPQQIQQTYEPPMLLPNTYSKVAEEVKAQQKKEEPPKQSSAIISQGNQEPKKGISLIDKIREEQVRQAKEEERRASTNDNNSKKGLSFDKLFEEEAKKEKPVSKEQEPDEEMFHSAPMGWKPKKVNQFYEPPKANEGLLPPKQPLPPKPQFNAMVNEEKQQSRKKMKKIVMSEFGGGNAPQTKPISIPRPFNPQKKGFAFADVLNEEQAKSQQQEQTEVPHHKSGISSQKAMRPSRFQQLIMDEKKKQNERDYAPIPTTPAIEEPSIKTPLPPKRTKTNKKLNDELFWGTDEVAYTTKQDDNGEQWPSFSQAAPLPKAPVKKQDPVKWLAKQLEIELGEHDGTEFAESIYKKPRKEIIRFLLTICESQQQATKIVDRFFKTFPELET